MSKNNDVRVVPNNYDVELKINNFSEKFNIKHKMGKKGKLEIMIKDDMKAYKLTLKETKEKLKVKQIKVIETINNKQKETSINLSKIEFVDDFEIKVRDFYVPVTILINPVLEVYYDIDKIDTEMKANKDRMKMKKNKYTIDCSIKKEGYIVESSALSIEELKELYDEDKDNQLGVYLEYLKRNHEQEDEEIVNESVVEEAKSEIDILNEKYEESLKQLKEKYELEKEKITAEVTQKIKEQIKNQVIEKAKEMGIEEKSIEEPVIEKIPLTDALCNVFEDCGKKVMFFNIYDADKENFDKEIKNIVINNKGLIEPVLKVLDDKITNGTSNEKIRAIIMKNNITKINDKINDKERIISKLNEAAKGTLDNYSLNVISRAKKFGEKIKFMSLHPTSDEVYEVLCSKDKHDAAYILSTVMAAIE